MQFKKSTVVGVVMTLYLSTGSWCHYIPEKKTSVTANKKNEGSPHKTEQIQICGNQLTSLIIEACDGIVGSLTQVGSSRDIAQTKITEDCCDHKCPLDYLQSYCGQVPLFTTKKSLRGNLLNKIGGRNRAARVEGSANAVRKEDLKTPSEVRTKEKRRRKERTKKKRSFKRKCAFNSFGHFLLTLDSTNSAKRHNNINRTWPSIQVGTISPDMDKFGGQPTVVVKKNRINLI